jgi:hypothetical protein
MLVDVRLGKVQPLSPGKFVLGFCHLALMGVFLLVQVENGDEQFWNELASHLS